MTKNGVKFFKVIQELQSLERNHKNVRNNYNRKFSSQLNSLIMKTSRNRRKIGRKPKFLS